MKKAALDAIESAFSALTEAKRELLEESNTTECVPVYMTIKEYAAHRKVSESTVRRWLSGGMPLSRRGKIVRIVVADADRWDEREHVRRLAEIRGAGGR